MFMRLYSVDKL